jgi:hypothetical protein
MYVCSIWTSQIRLKTFDIETLSKCNRYQFSSCVVKMVERACTRMLHIYFTQFIQITHEMKKKKVFLAL